MISATTIISRTGRGLTASPGWIGLPAWIAVPTAATALAVPYGLLLLERLLDWLRTRDRPQVNHPADTRGLIVIPLRTGLLDDATDLVGLDSPVDRQHGFCVSGPPDPQESDHHAASQPKNDNPAHCVQQGVTPGQSLALNFDPPRHLALYTGILGGPGRPGIPFIIVAGDQQEHCGNHDYPVHLVRLPSVSFWLGRFDKFEIRLMFILLGLVIGLVLCS
ncbi:MAG: hypothetical protein WCP45_00715 [Verrucomicrobiota bacterium]